MVDIYLYFGTLYDTDGTTPVANATVKGRNESTSKTISTTTNASGQYILDFSNIEGGWKDGDTLTAYTIYTNAESTESATVDLATVDYTEQDLTLTEVIQTDQISYCTVQDVWDELDGKTFEDISSDRIIKSVRRAEGIIDLKTGTFFTLVTRTDEVHTGDRYTLDVSPDALDSFASTSTLRRDSWGSSVNNRVVTDFKPINSITSLSYNTAGAIEADSWTELTEQTGSGGGFYLEDPKAGVIDFLTTYPRIGKRSWKATYVTGYDRDSTERNVVSILKAVERLTILLASKSIITTKSSGSMFDSTRDVRIGTIEVKAGAASSRTYLESITPEITELWKELGDLGIEVI